VVVRRGRAKAPHELDQPLALAASDREIASRHPAFGPGVDWNPLNAEHVRRAYWRDVPDQQDQDAPEPSAPWLKGSCIAHLAATL
jgi:hypothetical protein